ncbi:MAG: flippase-like domain-containing protein [Planctomycetes bacterium]|nr:flippase-like domain-containing protein [Planctomycetota bacterium]
MSKPKAKLLLKVAVSLAFLGGMAWKLQQGDKWQQISDALGRIGALEWAGIWLAFVAGHAAGIWKWRYNVNLGIKSERRKLRGADAAQCYSAGMFANLCLPSIVGGDALKALLAAKITRRTEAAVVGGLIERLIDTFALLVLIVVGALLSREHMPGWLQSFVLVSVIVGCAGFVLFLPLVLRMKLARWPRKLRRTVGRALVAMRRLAERPHRALIVLGLSLAIQAWFVLLNARLGRAIGVEASLAVWFFAVPMTKAITLAPISFGGFGLREVALAKFLTGMAGVAEVDGWAASALWQSVLISTGLIGGGLWWVLGLRAHAQTGAGHGSLIDEQSVAGRASTRHG